MRLYVVIRSSLMPERVDGVHAGGLSGREVAEDNAHGTGEEKRDQYDARVEDKGNPQECGQAVGGGQAQEDADYPAQRGQYH